MHFLRSAVNCCVVHTLRLLKFQMYEAISVVAVPLRCFIAFQFIYLIATPS